MMKRILLAVCLSSVAFMQSAEGITANEIRWRNASGEARDKSDTQYSLLSVGFLHPELSSDFDALMAAWLKEHPAAEIVPVIIRRPFFENRPNSEFIVVWVVDRGDNLNVYLVSHGCVAAAQMFLSSDKELEPLRQKLSFPKDRLNVSPKKYDEIKKSLIRAEKLAKEKRLGIWANLNSHTNPGND